MPLNSSPWFPTAGTLIDGFIDWSMDRCLMPYRQYLRHQLDICIQTATSLKLETMSNTMYLERVTHQPPLYPPPPQCFIAQFLFELCTCFHWWSSQDILVGFFSFLYWYCICHICKIMEKNIFKYIHNFILENNILIKYQSGFQPNDSTVN